MNGLTAQSISIHFSPILPIEAISVFGFIMAAILLVTAFASRRMVLMRFLSFGVFMMLLLNPSLHEEKRERIASVAAVIVDESPSQEFGERSQRTQEALEHVRRSLAEYEGLEVREAIGPDEGSLASRTNLFKTLQDTYADVPESRRAGVIMITDGQVHDMPQIETLQDHFGPVHVMLSGEKQERDRRIVVTNAPAFGIVGQSLEVQFKIEDSGRIQEKNAFVRLRLSDGTEQSAVVRVGEENTMNLPVKHAGQNVFELSVDPVANELTERNNVVAIDFQGVRDRLRVLLVSGKPHAGGRTWRDLLTADPSVDLVHFTILREPDKIDSTPQSEMSLIAFPFRELFELKLYDFDLIIFDRYRLSRILPDHYFQNIARYVTEGGAFLEASGPAYASEDSIYYTALRDILPGTPTGEVYSQSFVPKVTEMGQNHPVTRSLVWKNPATGSSATWGDWTRLIGLENVKGDVLMSGAEGHPLLALNRVGEGRAAHIASDQIWLWSRGYHGGGPHAELLRRVVHWLMKEPELDELALDVRVDGHTIIVRRAGFEREEDIVNMTRPDGSTEEVTLTPSASGALEYLHRAKQTGIYRFETADGQLRFAVVGEVNPPELRNVLTSAEILRPLMEKTGGGAYWLSDTPAPRIRLIKSGRFAGQNWLALEDKDAFSVTGAQEKPLVPLWAALSLLFLLLLGTWYLEGRQYR